MQTDFPGSFRANLFDLLFFLFDFDALGGRARARARGGPAFEPWALAFVSPLGKVHIRRIFAVGNAR